MNIRSIFYLHDFNYKIGKIKSKVALLQIESAIVKRERECETFNESARYQTAKYLIQKRMRKLSKES